MTSGGNRPGTPVTSTGPMVRILQANPGMDRIELVDSFELGEVNRSVDVRVVPGGKGSNVARALRTLGVPVAAYGLVGGLVGGYLRAACASLGIVDRFDAIAGETRICDIIVERGSGRSTVLNEPGPRLTRSDGRRALARIVGDCQPDDIVIVAGSAAPGLPGTFCADVVTAVRERGARAVVDTSGGQLRHAMARAPWLIKTNIAEFGAVHGGRPLKTEAALCAAMRRQLDRGTWCVVVTQGAAGATAISRDGAWRVTVPSVRVVNATGSGDVFLAGLVAGLIAGKPLPDALARGAAGAVGSTQLLEPSLPAADVVERLRAEIVVTEG